jgi:dephospho-CoA kinase
MSKINPIGIFLLGGPGSGKDYVLKNIFSRFDLTEVQADQILNGAADELIRECRNIVVNGISDSTKIAEVQNILQEKTYIYDYVHVSVTNKVSRQRNEQREQPLAESKRIEKYLRAEELAQFTEAFVFNNSINLNESSELEKVFFADQIEKLLERVVNLGLEMKSKPEPKSFAVIKEKYFPPVAKDKESGLPKKYVAGLSPSTAKARAAHWREKSKLSDRDPKAYEPAPGDATAKTKPSKHTLAVRKMMNNEQVEADVKKPHTVENIAKKHKVDVKEILKALETGKKVEREHTNDEKTAEIIALAHLWERPDYYKMLAKMEQKESPLVPVTAADHVAAEKKDQKERDRRDWRILHHQNRHIHKAAMGEAIRRVPRSGNITAVKDKRELNDAERAAFEKARNAIATSKVQEETIEEGDNSIAAKAKKSGISVGTLRKVYNRGVAAWNSGHRPGTTPQQWGHARVNSYINKGKTYHTADKDLREETDINELFEMQLAGTDEYRKHAIAMTPGQNQEIEDAFPVKSPNKKAIAVPAESGKSIVSQYTAEESECGCGGDCGCESTNESSGDGSDSVVRKSFKSIREASKKEEEVDVTPKVTTKKKATSNRPSEYNSTLQGIPVAPRFSAFEEKKPELTIKEAVEYHLENKISFTENVFRPGSDMFFEMINEAKLLYKAGMYEPTDEWEADMLNSEIGEKAMYEGQEVILDYPFIEDIEQIDEVFNTVYPHTYHGTLRPEDPKSENGPEHLYLFRIPGKGNLRHTYSVSINRFEGKKGNLSFGYHGKQPADFVPVGKHGDRKYFQSGEHEVTGEGGGKASSIISTVKSIAQTHAKKHGLKTMVFAGSSDEPSRSKLYNRIVNRMGGKEHRSEDDEFDPYREYSVPVKEESNPTNGKGIGKPWREGGGGAVYVRDGDSIRKIRFSQSGMKKKFMDPGATRSFVARHRCLTNKDKTSASYWACRWPRFFSNSGKTWW